jgi:hypothetical protein
MHKKKYSSQDCPQNHSGRVVDRQGVNLPDGNQFDQIELTSDQKWAVYNRKMTALFAERDKYPVDSPERETAAEAILAHWVADGS